MALSADAQLRYIVQWFEEWSELQRSDFVPILASKIADLPYMNGLVNNISGLNCNEKPMSLFECRVKLFREWYQQWGSDHREKLMKNLEEIDPGFIEKLNSELQNGHTNENGIDSNIDLADNEV